MALSEQTTQQTLHRIVARYGCGRDIHIATVQYDRYLGDAGGDALASAQVWRKSCCRRLTAFLRPHDSLRPQITQATVAGVSTRFPSISRPSCCARIVPRECPHSRTLEGRPREAGAGGLVSGGFGSFCTCVVCQPGKTTPASRWTVDRFRPPLAPRP